MNFDLPKNWGYKKLGDIFSFKNGLNKSKEFFGSGTPIVNYTDVFKNNGISSNILKGQVRVSDNELKNHQVRKDDVFFTRTSETIEEIGMAAVVTEVLQKTVFSGFVLRARPKIKILDTFYQKYCFAAHNVRKGIIAKSSYTTRALTSGKLLSGVYIPIPPLPEQKKIAEILFIWDKAIEKTEKLIEYKKLLKKGLMQKLLTGKVRLKDFKNKRWVNVKLGDIFTERNERKGNNLPLLAITGGQGVLFRNMLNRHDTSNADKSKHKRICPGDIGYNTMRMWQGVSGVSPLEGIVSPAYTVVIPKKNVDSNYIGFLFKLPSTIYLFYRYSQGLVSDTWNLKYKHFKLVHIDIPKSIEEQKRIAKFFKSIDTHIEILTKELGRLKKQKKGLIQKLLTGRIRVKV